MYGWGFLSLCCVLDITASLLPTITSLRNDQVIFDVIGHLVLILLLVLQHLYSLFDLYTDYSPDFLSLPKVKWYKPFCVMNVSVDVY